MCSPIFGKFSTSAEVFFFPHLILRCIKTTFIIFIGGSQWTLSEWNAKSNNSVSSTVQFNRFGVVLHIYAKFYHDNFYWGLIES